MSAGMEAGMVVRRHKGRGCSDFVLRCAWGWHME